MSTIGIKYIGPYFLKRLMKESITTEIDLIKRANELASPEDLKAFLSKVFTNKRKNRCYQLYRIRETNFLAFNNTVKFLRSHRASKGLILLKNRSSEEAYPKKCIKKTN